jgi:hypothetical protein
MHIDIYVSIYIYDLLLPEMYEGKDLLDELAVCELGLA